MIEVPTPSIWATPTCLNPDPRVKLVGERVVARKRPSDKGELGLPRHNSYPAEGPFAGGETLTITRPCPRPSMTRV